MKYEVGKRYYRLGSSEGHPCIKRILLLVEYDTGFLASYYDGDEAHVQTLDRDFVATFEYDDYESAEAELIMRQHSDMGGPF